MADYKGLNIRFRGDTTEATKALNILSNEARTAQGNLTGLQKALDNTKTNGERLNSALKNNQLDNLAKAADAASGRAATLSQILPQLEDRLTRLRKSIADKKVSLADAISSSDGSEEAELKISSLRGSINSLEEDERSLAAQVEKTTTDVLTSASAANRAEAAYQQYAAALFASETKLGQFGTNATNLGFTLSTLGSSISSVGDKLTIVSGIAAVTFGRTIISNTEEFGNAISQLGGYLDIQGSKLQEMSDEALKWGKNTIFSATESAQAMNELAKGGMTQAQIQGGAMEATMELAAAGGLDMASAAEVAVQAIKTFGLEAKDSSAVADALAGAADKSTAEVAELANGFKYVGGWASMANWNINDVSGALALLSDHGLQSEMAGTALRNVMQRLAAPTNTAAKLMNQYGFSVRDSSGQMVSAVEVVQRLNDTFGELGDEEKQEVLNKIFGARALPAAVALMNEGSESLQKYIDATTEAGYAGEMAQNRLGDLGWALELLRGEAETATVTFGNALAPTIIDIAHAIEGALEAFNNLSSSQQENIAKMALFAVAAGPVLSIVGHLTSGIGSLVSGIGTAAKTIANFIELASKGGSAVTNFAQALAMAKTPMDGTAESMQKVMDKAAGIESSITTLAAGAAITAAIALFAALAAQVASAIEHEKELRAATDELYSSVENMDALLASASANAANMGDAFSMSANAINRSASDALKSQTELANTISDTISEFGTNAGLIETYASQIEELSSKSVLTASEQNELKNAVEQFNNIAETSISIVDAQTGSINTSASAIRDAANAYAEYARSQAIMSTYASVQKELVENELEQAKYQEILNNGYKDMSVVQALAAGATFEQIDATVAASSAMKEAKARGDSLNQTMARLKSMMSGAGVSAESYKDTINNLGIAAKNTGVLLTDTAEESTDDYGTALAGGIDEASQQAQKALKRQNDAIYKEQQRAYDAEYKALQKALDKEYKAQQKAYDKEYKAYQKQLSAEEDALKKSLDKQYEAQKDSLDDELKELKKAHDKQLKEAKKAYEADTKAFKAETDKRVAALEAEYKAKLKLLEDNSGTSEIDDQIKQLENQTKAEQAAIKKQQEAEKKAELEKAVAQAKTRRKRADAEAALNEYLAELAQEAREEEREAQIDALNDEKDRRKEYLEEQKEQLKEEYDARIEALKESRAAEQEAMDEANDLAYERLKEQLDEEYETRKEANDAKLEQIKEANEAEIEAMRESHSTMLENLKEQQNESLEAMKEGQQAQLEALKQSQEDQLQALKDSLDDQVDALKNGGGSMVSSANDTTKKLADDAEKRKQNTEEWKNQTIQKHLEAGLKAGEVLVSQLTGVDPILGATTTMLYHTATKNLPQMISDYENTGISSGLKFAHGIEGNTGNVEGAADAVVAAAVNSMNSFVSAAGDAGREGSAEFASNVGDSDYQAGINAQAVADAASDPLNRAAGDMNDSGWDFGVNFANGLHDTIDIVANAAANMASTIASYTHFSVPDRGPLADQDEWAPDMVDNFIRGMRSKEPELATQARRMAEIVNEEFNPETSSRYSLDYDLRATGAIINKGITEALRSGVPSQKGVTIVVQEMNVRKESDIDLVSERLYQKQQQAERRGWK